MRIVKIKRNRILMRFKNDYLIVDNKTAKQMEILDKSTNTQDFASRAKIPIKKAQRILQKIEKKLSNSNYYQKNLFLNTPIKVQWKITNKCNLRCKHCYLGVLSQKTLDAHELIKISEKIMNAGVLEITLTGGEALLVPNILEIVEKFVRHQIYVKIFTNGTLLIPFLEKIKALNNIEEFNKFLTFSLSVDGLKETHDKIRGDGTFEIVQRAIKELKELGFVIIINCVVSKINYNDIPQLLLLLNDMGIRNIQLSNIIIRGNADISMSLTRVEKMLLTEKIKHLAQNNNIHVLYGEEDGFDNIIYKDNNMTNGYFVENWKCCAGVTRMTIDYDGNVYCCPFCKDFSLGNIVNQELSEIWKNKNRFKFLAKLSSTKTKNGRMCIMTGGEENDK